MAVSLYAAFSSSDIFIPGEFSLKAQWPLIMHLIDVGWGEREVQLTLEWHRFKLRGSTYTWVFFNKYIEKFLEICDNLRKKKMNHVA